MKEYRVYTEYGFIDSFQSMSMALDCANKIYDDGYKGIPIKIEIKTINY